MSDNAADRPGQELPLRKREIARLTPPAGVSIYYANSVTFRPTFWDFTMDFGMIAEASRDKIAVQDVVTVVMSPQHAKAFAEILAKNIATYEAQFGPIPSPPSVSVEDGSLDATSVAGAS